MVEPVQLVTPAPTITPPAGTTPVTPVPPGTTPAAEPSVLDRIRQAPPVVPTPTPGEETFLPANFNVADIDKIADPNARAQAQAAYKSMQSGFTQKTQEIATLRKNLETQIETAKSPQPWTIERVQQITKDPQFITAAQQALKLTPGTGATGLSDEQYSTLTPDEKARLEQGQREGQKANAGVVALQGQLAQMQRQQQDVELKERYASYDPAEINKVEKDIIDGTMVPTREHLYKVVKYDADVQRAYELGRQDERGGITEKAQLPSNSGVVQVTRPGEVPAKEEKESNVDYFRRLAMARLAQHQSTPR